MKKVFLYQFLFMFISVLCGYATVLTAYPDLYTGSLLSVAGNWKASVVFLTALALYFAAINYWWQQQRYSTGHVSRSSNIELCRVICMLGIIAHHCVVHGGILGVETMTVNKSLAYIVLPWGKIGFDCFVAVSCWFLADRKFQTERFLKIWLTVLFYSVAFAIVSFCMGTPFTAGNWFSVFLPIAGNSHGFAASYLAFYLLLPFLNRMTQNLTKKQARILMWLFIYFEIGTQLIGYFARYYQSMPSELFVFLVCYLIALNLKRWPVDIIKKRSICFLIFVSVWICLWLVNYYFAIHPENQAALFIVSTMSDESSISNIIAGFALFFFFHNLKIKPLPAINCLAAGTFGILLIHDHNFFRYPLWGEIVKCRLWYDHSFFAGLAGMYVVWIFVSAYFVDYVRSRFFARWVLNSSVFENVCGRYNKIMDSEKEV